jgi:hypothetical protein
VCVYEQRERVALGVSGVDVMEWVAHLGWLISSFWAHLGWLISYFHVNQT